MPIHLDHAMVLSHNKVEAGQFLAHVLNVACGHANVGPFFAVYVSDSLTLDFDEVVEPYPIQHFCFRVTDTEFDEILERVKVAGIPFRSLPHGPNDRAVNTQLGGRILYWTAPDGHIWELLTRSYARRE
jgi:catechol 2,3-dioxygenase-like lactoylglutathione lyase family enzyme